MIPIQYVTVFEGPSMEAARAYGELYALGIPLWTEVTSPDLSTMRVQVWQKHEQQARELLAGLKPFNYGEKA